MLRKAEQEQRENPTKKKTKLGFILMKRKKSEEEDFDLDDEKPKRRKRGRRVKEVSGKVMLSDPLVPARRNPRRNAKKMQDSGNEEDVQK